MRQLASIQRVWAVEPIEGADKIELAKVKGWQCVIKKGDFKRYDLGVYFEIDSFLPIDQRYEFLRASSFRKNDFMGEGFKIRTMKFKGQLSQGLLLPLSEFPELKEIVSAGDAALGQDVTELLGVRKWEFEEKASTGGTMIGKLPPDVPHSDEIRIQSAPELLQEFGDREYYITTKMDGSSHSVSIDENGFHACGHNFEYKDDGKCSFWALVHRDGIQEKMQKYFDEHGLKTFTIQGELCAPGIQKNPLKLQKPEWYVFTVRVNGERVGLKQTQEICSELQLNMVPVEEVGTNLGEKYPTVEAMLARADGEYPNGGRKEGIVVRPTTPVYCEAIQAPLSFKAVSNKYLLKNDD